MDEALSVNGVGVLALFLLVLPGFLSILVYRLIQPGESKHLKDNLFEGLAFGTLNLAIMFWAVPVWFALKGFEGFWPNLARYGLVLLVFFIAPSLWPWALTRILSLLETRGLILRRAHNAWDSFFMQRRECWVIVHLSDGRRIGGFYGSQSFASLYPNSGHIYLEEVWGLDADGAFRDRIPDTAGVLFRPGDYDLIEFKQA